ncbi:hypothetical protein BDY19DRAFT_934785, partial [Irpex rosettiformis]
MPTAVAQQRLLGPPITGRRPTKVAASLSADLHVVLLPPCVMSIVKTPSSLVADELQDIHERKQRGRTSGRNEAVSSNTVRQLSTMSPSLLRPDDLDFSILDLP